MHTAPAGSTKSEDDSKSAEPQCDSIAVRTGNLLCPECHDVLDCRAGVYTCVRGKHVFSAVMDIPDFRLADPPYVTRTEDNARALALVRAYNQLSYADLLRLSFSTRDLGHEESTAHVNDRLARAALNRGIWDRRKALIRACGMEVPTTHAIDLGCGEGGFLSVVGPQMASVMGIDVVMEELVLARRLLDDRSVANVTLICAGGERLPVLSESAGLITATNVIEHVRNPARFITEAYRVLAPCGVLCFDSPNRWDLVNPEPHVGVRWVGLWPRALQEQYVRWACGKAYKEKRLLSLPELRRLLVRAIPEASHKVFYWPRWHEPRRSRTVLGRWLFRIAVRTGGMNRLWAYFVGVHEVVVWTPPDGSPPSHDVVPMPVASLQ